MRFKKPLTRADLEAIQTRNLDSDDMRTVLWEVARLRSLVVFGALPGQQGDLLESIRKMLADKPCVKEFPKLPPDA